MGTMVQGMAFGTGSAIAHRAVGAAAGAMSGGGDSGAAEAPAASAAPAANPCMEQQKYFQMCLEQSNNNAATCADYFKALSECQVNAKNFA